VFTFYEFFNGRPHVFILYLCERVSGEIRLSPEHTEYKWAGREDILKLKTESYLRAFLERG
jgi:hypothetical protein